MEITKMGGGGGRGKVKGVLNHLKRGKRGGGLQLSLNAMALGHK